MRSDIFIEPAVGSNGPFWIGAPREGFTLLCSRALNVTIPVEDVTAGEAIAIQKRRDIHATLLGYQYAKSNHAIRTSEASR